MQTGFYYCAAHTVGSTEESLDRESASLRLSVGKPVGMFSWPMTFNLLRAFICTSSMWCHVHTWCQWGQKRANANPGTGVRDGCGPLWELKIEPRPHWALSPAMIMTDEGEASLLSVVTLRRWPWAVLEEQARKQHLLLLGLCLSSCLHVLSLTTLNVGLWLDHASQTDHFLPKPVYWGSSSRQDSELAAGVRPTVTDRPC